MNLDRFISAQELSYNSAFTEIEKGRKQTHWMWYIFPQIKGLGFSETSNFYGIENIEEAIAYVQHPLLGARLVNISKLLLEINDKTATQIFGTPDDLKLKSSMTLFARVPHADPVFKQVLNKYFDGKLDNATLSLLDK